MTRTALLIAPLIALTSACGLGTEFRDALPSERTVTIQAPESNGQALTSADASLGERSEFYEATRAMTRDVNGGVRGIVLLLEAIVREPATSTDGDKYTWGPGADALSPVIYRLVAEKTDEGRFTYRLQYRPRGTDDIDDNYLSLVEGNADVSSGVEDGLGDMTLYVDNWVAVEPGACGSGTLHIDYDTTSEPQFLAVEFDNFSDTCPDAANHEAMEAATYYYARNADGSGNFQFTALGDVDDGTALAGTKETFAIRSRWLASGEGRSDVRISGGDLLENHGLEAVSANECWDDMFLLTYADMDPPGIDPDHANLGSEEACVSDFASAEYATDLHL